MGTEENARQLRQRSISEFLSLLEQIQVAATRIQTLDELLGERTPELSAIPLSRAFTANRASSDSGRQPTPMGAAPSEQITEDKSITAAPKKVLSDSGIELVIQQILSKEPHLRLGAKEIFMRMVGQGHVDSKRAVTFTLNRLEKENVPWLVCGQTRHGKERTYIYAQTETEGHGAETATDAKPKGRFKSTLKEIIKQVLGENPGDWLTKWDMVSKMENDHGSRINEGSLRVTLRNLVVKEEPWLLSRQNGRALEYSLSTVQSPTEEQIAEGLEARE